MSISQDTELDRADVDDILASNETAVISMARADEPYSIPVSYGYDSDEGAFYLRLVSTPDSEKRRYLSSTPRVKLVVYEEDDGVYRSVVAQGTLDEVPREDLTAEHVEQYGDARRPLFEIWGRDREDLDVELYKVEPDDVSGRLVEVDREQ